MLIEQFGDPAGEVPATAIEPVADPLADDDLQLALYLCYELHYRGLDGVDDAWEWRPSLLAFRNQLEELMTDRLLAEVGAPEPFAGSVGDELFALVAADDGPQLARHLASEGTLDQFREFAIHRSAYQLKEADPHTWAIPRISGPAKAALVEVQADEYGGGEPERMHSQLFARTMRALGLDPTYGAYVERLPGTTLATVNLISLFGLHRRWRGALVGHLAGFEISSPEPNRRYANGLRRLGLGAEATDFFDEHVEADSVHENIAAYDLAGGLAEDEGAEIAGDILFGIRSLLRLDNRFAARLLGAWESGGSALLGPVALVA